MATIREMAETVATTLKGTPELWFDKVEGLYVVGIPHRSGDRKRYTLIAHTPTSVIGKMILRTLLMARRKAA